MSKSGVSALPRHRPPAPSVSSPPKPKDDDDDDDYEDDGGRQAMVVAAHLILSTGPCDSRVSMPLSLTYAELPRISARPSHTEVFFQLPKQLPWRVLSVRTETRRSRSSTRFQQNSGYVWLARHAHLHTAFASAALATQRPIRPAGPCVRVPHTPECHLRGHPATAEEPEPWGRL